MTAANSVYEVELTGPPPVIKGQNGTELLKYVLQIAKTQTKGSVVRNRCVGLEDASLPLFVVMCFQRTRLGLICEVFFCVSSQHVSLVDWVLRAVEE